MSTLGVIYVAKNIEKEKYYIGYTKNWNKRGIISRIRNNQLNNQELSDDFNKFKFEFTTYEGYSAEEAPNKKDELIKNYGFENVYNKNKKSKRLVPQKVYNLSGKTGEIVKIYNTSTEAGIDLKIPTYEVSFKCSSTGSIKGNFLCYEKDIAKFKEWFNNRTVYSEYDLLGNLLNTSFRKPKGRHVKSKFNKIKEKIEQKSGSIAKIKNNETVGAFKNRSAFALDLGISRERARQLFENCNSIERDGFTYILKR